MKTCIISSTISFAQQNGFSVVGMNTQTGIVNKPLSETSSPTVIITTHTQENNKC